jgi:hypothetical protein
VLHKSVQEFEAVDMINMSLHKQGQDNSVEDSLVVDIQVL